ncbi:MAG: hypothetical protein GY926_19645 [bacterium]|nr:hypothetical protein [bacterium]
MEGKIELFGEKMSRHEKAGHMLRADWFEGRIARWTAALRWVRRHFVRLTRRMGRRLYREIENRVEDQVPCETFAKWCMDKPRGR